MYYVVYNYQFAVCSEHVGEYALIGVARVPREQGHTGLLATRLVTSGLIAIS